MVTLLLFSMCLNKENASLYEHITWFSKVYVKRGLFSSCIKSQGRAMAQLLSFITDSLFLFWHPCKGYGHAFFSSQLQNGCFSRWHPPQTQPNRRARRQVCLVLRFFLSTTEHLSFHLTVSLLLHGSELQPKQTPRDRTSLPMPW